jgi:hypothetical protein
VREFGRIYALRDPETGRTRYVGQTVHAVGARLNGHLTGARHGAASRCAVWLRTLPTEPQVVTLEDGIPVDRLDERELAWVTKMVARGERLVNTSLMREVSRA